MKVVKPLNTYRVARKLFLPNLVWCFSALVLIAALSETTHAQSFQWKLSAGDVFDVHMTQESTTTTEYEKRTTVQSSVNSLKMRWKVLESKGNVYTIEQTIASIATSSGNPANPGQAFSLDTDSDKKPTPKEVKLLSELRSLVGISFLFRMDRTGQVMSVEIPVETKSKLASIPHSSFAAAFTADTIKDRLKLSTMIVPDKELKPGDSWESATSSTEANDVLPVNYKFSGIETTDGKEMAVFKWTAEKPEESDTNSETSSLIDYTEFSQSGTLWMDVKAGYFVDCEMGSTVAGERLVNGEPINSKVESTTKMLIKKVIP